MKQTGDTSLLADKAQNVLWDALRSGQLRGGQFLSISQLVEILNCPIAPTREAVKQACSQGLLFTLPKRGIQVMDVTPDRIRACLDFRMVLDQEGARRRISKGSMDGLEGLRTDHEHMLNAVSSEFDQHQPRDAIKIDVSLHDFLVDGLENEQLLAAYDANRMRIAIIQNARPFVQDRIKSAMEEHLSIIDALERRDPASAVDAIKFHFDQTRRWWGVV